MPHRQQPLPIVNVRALCIHSSFEVYSKGSGASRTTLGTMERATFNGAVLLKTNAPRFSRKQNRSKFRGVPWWPRVANWYGLKGRIFRAGLALTAHGNLSL